MRVLRVLAHDRERELVAHLLLDEIIRDREELSEQTRALKELQKMAASYGLDISGPARTGLLLAGRYVELLAEEKPVDRAESWMNLES